MPRELKAWLAKDGTTHKTHEKALEAERMPELQKVVAKVMEGFALDGNIPRDTVARFIINNRKTLYVALRNYMEAGRE